MSTVNLGWNPKRVLFGLSRIGYTPHSAIADIVDNSVTNGAKNVFIKIQKVREDLSDSRKNNIKDYLIIDDGVGMDDEGILAALELGSDQLQYGDESLSKFGLGLKSAAFSQGSMLEVISSSGEGFLKYVVDLDSIDSQYFCEKKDLTDDDKKIIDDYLSEGRGTIVRISKIHTNNHPSPKNTIDELLYRLGTIYYYFIRDGVRIELNGEGIEPYDVLFTGEAEEAGNLNEHDWDGRSVAWIKKPTSQTLDIDSSPAVQAVVEVTQLPHPPTFSLDGEGEQERIRKKYKIGAGNYGFYVYRNKRLISWAERFDGLIPQDQDFYAFRGRILLDSSADNPFNIDVKKSHLVLSEEAWNALSDLSDEYKRKSKKAWQHAAAVKKQMLGEEPNTISNDIAAILDLPDHMPGAPLLDPDEEKEQERREDEIKSKIKEKIRREAQEARAAAGDSGEPTEDEVASLGTGGAEGKYKKIFRVSAIEDNLLWEPYFDDDHGWSVRINRGHRYARCLFEDNSENTDMQVMVELFLLQCAQAEIALRRSISLDSADVEEVIRSYRESVSNLLVQMVRRSDIQLPPLG